MPTLNNELTARPYPGRGIVAARTLNGQWAICYFLTGRSNASRQRELVLDERGVIVVDSRLEGAHDPLRHYRAIDRREGLLVVGNGDQVETFANDVQRGAEPWTAWKKHDVEPDPPIFTPRLLLALIAAGDDRTLHLAAVRNAAGPENEPGRTMQSWTPAEAVRAGAGLLLSTYQGTTKQVTIGQGPTPVDLASETPADLEAEVWNSLDVTLRVASVTVTAEGLPVGTHHS